MYTCNPETFFEVPQIQGLRQPEDVTAPVSNTTRGRSGQAIDPVPGLFHPQRKERPRVLTGTAQRE